MNNHAKLIILGSGPAGFTAAIYAARAEIDLILLTGKLPGGQLTETSVIENFPGFPDGILGLKLMTNMQKQAEKFGARVINDMALKVNFKTKPLTIETEKEKYYSDTVIIATGARARWLGLNSETKFRGKGVSACAICDGPLYKNKDVVVIGGGDAAMEEALFLTKFAKSVKIIHRRNEFRASKIMLDRAINHPKIELITNSQIIEFQGEKYLSSIKIKNISGQESEIKIDGAFLAIGHIPNSSLFKEYFETKEDYLVVAKPPLTHIPGIFVAGDVYDARYRQAVTAAGSGCQAALEAEKYLNQ